MLNNNCAFISGEITKPFKYKFKRKGERFFETQIATARLSDILDMIPIVASEYVLDVSQNYTGVFAIAQGRTLTHNSPQKGGGKKLEVYVFADSISFPEYPTTDADHVCLDGFLCKPPVLRETPLGKTVCDFFVAVNRNYVISDYIPCICWGRTARFVSKLNVGTHVFVKGRFQSREYIKKISESEDERRIAYEISAYCVEVKNDGKKN